MNKDDYENCALVMCTFLCDTNNCVDEQGFMTEIYDDDYVLLATQAIATGWFCQWNDASNTWNVLCPKCNVELQNAKN